MKINKEKLVLFSIYSAFLAVVVFLIGTTTAMLYYPDYSFLNQFISELGIRAETGSLQAALYPEIFYVTAMLTAILLLPLFPAMYFILELKGIIRRILQIIISLSGIAAAVFLFLVGVFDAGLFLEPHVFVALGLYYCIIIICLLWGVAILALNKDSPYKRSKLWIVDPIVSVTGIIVGMINAGLFGLNDIFTSFLPMAFYQKLLAYIFMVFFGYVAIRMTIILKKTKNIELLDLDE